MLVKNNFPPKKIDKHSSLVVKPCQPSPKITMKQKNFTVFLFFLNVKVVVDSNKCY